MNGFQSIDLHNLLSDSAATNPDDGERQTPALSDLAAHAWFQHPETRLMYHRSDEVIEVYCNATVYQLPPRADLLEQLQDLCASRDWSQQLMGESLAYPELAELLLELASRQAILPVID